MSEAHDAQNNEAPTDNGGAVKLGGVFAFKEGMTTIFTENGEAVPVTVLRYEPWIVTQVKTAERDGYRAVQIASTPRKAKNCGSAERSRLKAAGFENGARFVREVREGVPDGATIGQKVALDSLSEGDTVKVTGRSKGHGFCGSQKRFGFAGGPASHGSKFHRRPGSSGNRTWPGRVMPGKKFPGHWGDETVSVKSVKVVKVNPEDGVLLVKGPVPGARNSLVRLVKEG